MELYTTTVANYHVAKRQNAIVIDVCARTGQDWLAPPLHLASSYVKGQIDNEVFATRYAEHVRTQMKQEGLRDTWERLLLTPRIAIAGFREPGEFCQRHVLKELLMDDARAAGLPVHYMGELLSDGKLAKGPEYHELVYQA